ncbi:Gfo/Idh/MocA family protein [Rhodopila globiformis]|uniref:Oxidoreductase n=1 Tax=Rhodopila globiformis TaxID=1071 RepID=A0A2S6MWP2_RHOGL|nr:Gfo/Idh/MocA family oxidoreductase [Rhodopila globiformis]PPQ26782.1 oxidoreductase [Rhodopila globiformis]
MTRFAAIGLDHRHVYDMTAGLLAAGAACAGHDPETTDPRVLVGFRKRFPDVPAIERERLLDDPSIDFVVLAAVPRDRAALAIEAMRRGKDVMVDKPGVTTADQLAAVEAAVRETGRIWSICLGRLTSPAVQAALAVVRSGEIGRLVSLTSLAPHRLNRALRPAWFFERAAYGGIINDIGTHSIDQFLAFAEAKGAMMDATILSSTIGAFGTEPPGFEDFAAITLRSDTMLGSIRLDWFTPDGMPDWGDGRLFLVGTDGTLELRKNLDIEGRAGGEHMFVANRQRTRYQDCSGVPVTYYRDFLDDVRDRAGRVSEDGRAFSVCRLALRCQQEATRFAPVRRP